MEKRQPSYIAGLWIRRRASTTEDCTEVSQKMKNRTTM